MIDDIKTKGYVKFYEPGINDLVNIVAEVEADIYDETDELWEEIDGISMSVMRIVELQQRVALLEKTLEFINREHKDMLDPRH